MGQEGRTGGDASALRFELTWARPQEPSLLTANEHLESNDICSAAFHMNACLDAAMHACTHPCMHAIHHQKAVHLCERRRPRGRAPRRAPRHAPDERVVHPHLAGGVRPLQLRPLAPAHRKVRVRDEAVHPVQGESAAEALRAERGERSAERGERGSEGAEAVAVEQWRRRGVRGRAPAARRGAPSGPSGQSCPCAEERADTHSTSCSTPRHMHRIDTHSLSKRCGGAYKTTPLTAV